MSDEVIFRWINSFITGCPGSYHEIDYGMFAITINP